MAGALPPGQVLTISSLAEQFDISPMPVREALNRLVADHALEQQPNRSFLVPAMTRVAFFEVTMIRCRLEGLAAEMATGRIGPEALAEMTALNRRLEREAELSPADLLALNRRFHFQLYEAAGLPRLLSIIEEQWVRIGPVLRLYVQPRTRGTPIRPHRALLAALKARDPAAASAAIADDLQTAADLILARLGR